MPDRPSRGLAARFKAALDDKMAEQRRLEEDRQRQQQVKAQARTRLLADLAAFGAEVGWFDVTSGDEVVVYRYEGRTIRFEAQGPADGVRVRADGVEDEVRLFLHDALDRWTLAVQRSGAAEDQKLFFDAGMEYLLGRVFGLRAGAPPPATKPEPADRPTGKGRTL